MSEKVGKHKGAVETLLHEKKELSRLLQIVNSQLQRHLSALENEGIDTEEYLENLQEEGEQEKSKNHSDKKKNRSRDEKRKEESDSEVSVEDELEPEDRDFNPHN